MCDFLGGMVLLKKTAPTKFLCWCLLWFANRRDLVAFLRCKHTHRNGGVRDVYVLICTRVVQIGVARLSNARSECHENMKSSHQMLAWHAVKYFVYEMQAMLALNARLAYC